jgi:hypothetical protein
MSLKVSAIFPSKPTQATGSLTEKSPSLMVWRLARIRAKSSEPEFKFFGGSLPGWDFSEGFAFEPFPGATVALEAIILTPVQAQVKSSPV